MGQLSYSLCLSLFHSLWQSALLLFIYHVFYGAGDKLPAAVKRNILYIFLFMQVVISCFTFFACYSGIFQLGNDLFQGKFKDLFIKQRLPERISFWMMGAYLFILSFKTGRLIYSWQCFKKTCSSALIKPPVDLRIFTSLKANEFGIKRKVTLWFSNAVSSPLTFGFLRPVIFMPVALMNHLSVAEAESLIIHELTHIRNNDYILNWLLIIAENIFFFNPFIKIICNKIRLEREKNCDLQVLSFQYPVISYAETLLKAARCKTHTNVFQLNAVFKNNQLLQRIRFFSGEHKSYSINNKNNGIALSCLVIAALLINISMLDLVLNFRNSSVNPVIKTSTKNTDGKIIPSSTNNEITVSVSNLKYQREILKNKISSLKRDLRKLKPLTKKVSENFPDDPEIIIDENYAIPAAGIELDDTKDVILKEESSVTGQTVTKAYQVKWKNGEWVANLLWMITESRPERDSIKNMNDSLRVEYVPIIQ